MLYTIGYTKSYEQLFREHPPEECNKLGKGNLDNGEPYAGGAIWITKEDAQNYLVSNKQYADYSVYGVDCELEDTEEKEGQSYRNLLKTSKLIQLKR